MLRNIGNTWGSLGTKAREKTGLDPLQASPEKNFEIASNKEYSIYLHQIWTMMSSLGAREGIKGGGFFKPLNPSPISSTVEGAGDSFPPTGTPQHNEREQRWGQLLLPPGGVDPTDVPVVVPADTKSAPQHHKGPGAGGLSPLLVSALPFCTSSSTFEPVMCSAVGTGPGGGYRQPRLRFGEVVEPFQATMVGPHPMVGTAILDAGVGVPGSQEDNSPAGGLPKVQKILGGWLRLSWVTPNTPLWVWGWSFPPGRGSTGRKTRSRKQGKTNQKVSRQTEVTVTHSRFWSEQTSPTQTGS